MTGRPAGGGPAHRGVGGGARARSHRGGPHRAAAGDGRRGEHGPGVHAGLAGHHAQLADHLLGGGALHRLVAGHRREQVAQRRRQLRRDLGGAVQAGDRGLEGVARELPAGGDALEEHQAQRVDVGGRSDLLTAHLLRRQVRRGADDHAGGGDVRGVGEHGDAEVRQVRAPVGVEQHVAGLDVAVHDAVAVHVGQRVAEGRAEGDDVAERERTAADAVGEGLALDELHDEVGAVALLADVVDRHQAGVVHAGERLDLALAPGLVGLADTGREQLDRDVTAQQLVARPEHLGGAAPADEVTEGVSPPTHGGRRARLRRTHARAPPRSGCSGGCRLRRVRHPSERPRGVRGACPSCLARSARPTATLPHAPPRAIPPHPGGVGREGVGRAAARVRSEPESPVTPPVITEDP